MHPHPHPHAHPRPRVVIPGGSGFLGRGLTPFLLDRGYDVAILSRSPRPADLVNERVAWHVWDDRTVGGWAACLEGAAALVNLVGRSVDCRKTPDNARDILDSRVNSCRVLGEALRNIESRGGVIPPVWVQSATAHIVGDPEPLERVCDESTPPGPMDEMAPRVGVAWEEAYHQAKLPSQRGVVLRISFVIGPPNPGGGGAMGKLSTLTRLILRCIEDATYSGVFMATSPNPVTNADFMKALRTAYHRPPSPPAPAWAVRLASRWLMNTDPDLALKGRRCVPTRLMEEGFAFDHRLISDAVSSAL